MATTDIVRLEKLENLVFQSVKLSHHVIMVYQSSARLYSTVG